MSLRRFVAYFLAITAGSTVAFASVRIEPATRPEMLEPVTAPARTAFLPVAKPGFRSHRHSPKVARLALAD